VLESIPMTCLGGLATVVVIVCLVRLGGGKPNWATLAGILATGTIAQSIQSGVGLPEHVFPLLCGVLIGPYVLLAMWLSRRHAARGNICGNGR
jgi:hypothetical protein